MPSINPLMDCRKKCFDAFRVAVAEATTQFKDNFTACKDAYAAALIACRTDPDPDACRERADDNFTDCARQSAELLSNQIENARLQMENCLTMCALQYPRPSNR